uniref:BPI2 domain-containing protein n=1 Tax=Angiostrongylus cantonensis TaxID=6313 RepID=A0A0K0D3S6_ANGCA
MHIWPLQRFTVAYRYDQYLVSFSVKQSEGDVKWSIHMSSAPYEMATMKENCKQVKKSPHILRNLPLTERTVSGSEIIGNTVVLNNENSILACATVILPGLPLLRASFHVAPFEGHIHIIPFQNKARILPDLRYDSDLENEDLEAGILSWKFVSDCEGKITAKESVNENELGVDSRATGILVHFSEIPRNFTFQMLRLLLNGEMLACAPIFNVELRQVRRGLHLLSQAHYFEPVRSASDFTMGNLHIRDDCLDIATETVHSNFENFYPTMNIFGMDSVVLKSLVANNSCGPLRPQFPPLVFVVYTSFQSFPKFISHSAIALTCSTLQ